MTSIFKNKKSNVVLDSLAFFVVLFVIAMAFIFIYYIQSSLNTDIQAEDDLSAEGKAVNQSLVTRYPSVIDNAILLFVILFWLVALIASYLSDTHPVFFIFSIILLLFVFVVVILLGNMFNEIFTEDIPGMAAYFPFTFFIFNHILPIAIALGFSIAVVLFAKQ